MPKAKPKTNTARPLEGRTAVITGSGRNIGKAIALTFARAGANVVVNGHRDKEALNSVVKAIKAMDGNAIAVVADVSKPAGVSKLVKAAVKEFGAVDIAVSNASIRRRHHMLDVSLAEWHQIMDTNLFSAVNMAREVLPGMIKRKWGRIIHLSGEDGFAGHVARRAPTMISKAAVHALSKAITQEFGEYGITANTVSPGPTDTKRDWTQYPPNWARERVKPTPLKRVATVDDVANACLYFAADSGGFIAGQAIHVNGGLFMWG